MRSSRPGAQPSFSADARPEHPIPEPLKQPPPSSFECRWADTPITLDGVADEPAWKTAQAIAAFHLPWLGDKARLGRTATTAKLLWDREYLYFLADMEDSDLFADVTEHDGELWNNDVFELFFRPAADKTGYYEFQVNAAGTTFDAFYPKYDATTIVENYKKGEFHMESKVKLRGTLNKRDDADKGWSVEGRIPWTDFMRTGGRPGRGREVEDEPVPVRLPHRLEGPGAVVRRADREEEDPAVLPPERGLRHASPSSARTRKAKPFGVEKAEPLTTFDRGRLPRPAAAVRRDAGAGRSTGRTSPSTRS